MSGHLSTRIASKRGSLACSGDDPRPPDAVMHLRKILERRGLVFLSDIDNRYPEEPLPCGQIRVDERQPEGLHLALRASQPATPNTTTAASSTKRVVSRFIAPPSAPGRRRACRQSKRRNPIRQVQSAYVESVRAPPARARWRRQEHPFARVAFQPRHRASRTSGPSRDAPPPDVRARLERSWPPSGA